MYRKKKYKKNTRKNKKYKGGGNAMKFGMLFSIPRNEKEAETQIPENIKIIQKLKPNIIGLVSPSDSPGDKTLTRSRMWDFFASELQKNRLSHLVMQHFPYTSVGSIGKITGTRVTPEILEKRLQDIKAKDIPNILALKGWEQNENYLKKNEISANQPEYLFKNVPEWIRELRPKFEGIIAATTYMEGHPFRRRMITEQNSREDWWAIKTEYTQTGEKFHTGILKSNLILGIKYDIEKLLAGANKIICNMIFDATLFQQYKQLFIENIPGDFTREYELIPEISLGFSKRSFYNDTLLSSVFCPDNFQDRIWTYGMDYFKVGDKVTIIGRDEEFAVVSQRKNAYLATILKINENCHGLKCYDIQYIDNGNIENNVPINRITTDEVDIEISIFWKEYMKEQVRILKNNNNTSIYVISVDMVAANIFIEECLKEQLLKSSTELYGYANYPKGLHVGGSYSSNFGGIYLK